MKGLKDFSRALEMIIFNRNTASSWRTNTERRGGGGGGGESCSSGVLMKLMLARVRVKSGSGGVVGGDD